MAEEGSKVVWEYQSNTNPWDPAEAAEWKDYPDDHQKTIEAAFQQDPQSIIEIGHYIIDMKDMVQINKDDNTKQRRIKRKDQ